MNPKIEARLRELAAVQPESFFDYFKRLDTRSITPVGNGANAWVFQHPTMSDVVVKVFGDHDLGYRLYLDWVLRNQHNKYVPKVLEEKEFSDARKARYVGDYKLPHAPRLDNAYSIVFLEKLTPVSSTVETKFRHTLQELLSKYKGRDDVSLKTIANVGVAGWNEIRQDAGGDKDLADIAGCFCTAYRKHIFLDLGNRRNIMQRGDQIVFVDPFQ